MRHPPTVLFDSAELTQDRFPSLWPETSLDDWCSEFQFLGPGKLTPI